PRWSPRVLAGWDGNRGRHVRVPNAAPVISWQLQVTGREARHGVPGLPTVARGCGAPRVSARGVRCIHGRAGALRDRHVWRWALLARKGLEGHGRWRTRGGLIVVGVGLGQLPAQSVDEEIGVPEPNALSLNGLEPSERTAEVSAPNQRHRVLILHREGGEPPRLDRARQLIRKLAAGVEAIAALLAQRSEHR